MNVDELILKALARRVDPETGLVQPLWKKLVQEVGVSRATLARQLAKLRTRGAFDVVFVRKDPDRGITYYRLKEHEHCFHERQNPYKESEKRHCGRSDKGHYGNGKW